MAWFDLRRIVSKPRVESITLEVANEGAYLEIYPFQDTGIWPEWIGELDMVEINGIDPILWPLSVILRGFLNLRLETRQPEVVVDGILAFRQACGGRY